MFHGRLTPALKRGLDVLDDRLVAAKIPPSKLDETLTVATWNVREFGKRARHPASLHYIAEIIGRFDLVSIVELRDKVDELETVLSYLGNYWRVVYSDYIPDPGGNRERIGYVYDTRAVTFTGLASHAAVKRKRVGTEYQAELGWWRPPYMASFMSGDFELLLLAAHIRWGDEGEKGRVPELELLASWVADRAKSDPRTRDVLVVGDFNIPDLRGPAYKAVTAKGLLMPKALAGVKGSNLAQDKRYDQILHLPSFSGAFTARAASSTFTRATTPRCTAAWADASRA